MLKIEKQLDQSMVLNKLKLTNYKKQNLNSNLKLNTNLYDKFVGFLVKKGNKKKAKSIIERCFSKVFLKIKLNNKYKAKRCLNLLLITIFKKMRTFIEIRKIKKRKFTNFVPFAIKKNRQIFLTVKWILLALKKDKHKNSFDEKLKKEIIKVLYNKKDCFSLELKKQNTNQSIKYRSNIHFRW